MGEQPQQQQRQQQQERPQQQQQQQEQRKEQQEQRRDEPVIKSGSFAHARDFLHYLAAGARHSSGSLPGSSNQPAPEMSGCTGQELPAQRFMLQAVQEASWHGGKASRASELPGMRQLVEHAGPKATSSPSGSSHPGGAPMQPAPASPGWQQQLLSSPEEQPAGGRRAVAVRPLNCEDTDGDELDGLLRAAAKRQRTGPATWGGAPEGDDEAPAGGPLLPRDWQQQLGSDGHGSAWPSCEQASPLPGEPQQFLQSLQQDSPALWQRPVGGGQVGWAALRDDEPQLGHQALERDHFLNSLQPDEPLAPWERDQWPGL
ncbi:hypothetical protein ABPG77_002162 [Micractinium sp. CCAP 211/92]